MLKHRLVTKDGIKKMLSLLLCMLIIWGYASPLQTAIAADNGVTNAKVVMRKSADKDAKVLVTLYKGEDVDILKASGDWYRVRYGKYTGYVMKKYISTNSASVSSASTTSSSHSSVDSRIKALGSAPGIMRVGDYNSDVKKLQQALEILGYYNGEIDSKYGNGTKAAVKAYQKAKGLTADGYAGERTVKSIFGKCSSVSLTTQAAPGSSSSATSSTSSSSSSSSKYPTVNSIAEIGSAPAASRKGDSGTKVVKLQQALECLGYYSGAIDGSYGNGTYNAVKRFQSKRGMKADGIAGAATIRILFGSSASGNSSSSSSPTTTKYKTELLDWYKNNVSRLIPKGARFTVKDVGTGKTFEMVRWSGADHMDVEPRSDKDTQTIKSIYGGSFSWRRRPILIKYNGHVYAASMNGMPHGTDTISNEFDGHLCIHFKNSKTHGSDKVDPDHQSAVIKASKATW